MADPEIIPLPAFYIRNGIRESLWQSHPPIFESPPTLSDIELALALIDELDADSQRWYKTATARLRQHLAERRP